MRGALWSAILTICMARPCAAAGSLLLETGASFGPGASGPVIGLELALPRHWLVGTNYWGASARAPADEDVHGGFRLCRGALCGFAGAAYLLHTDWLQGSHWNFALSLSWRFGTGRAESVEIYHESNADLLPPNYGRNAGLIGWRITAW